MVESSKILLFQFLPTQENKSIHLSINFLADDIHLITC